MILLAVFLLGIVSIGCSRITKVVVIDKQDIVAMPKGVAYTPDRDGCFYSNSAESEVMEAKRFRLNK